jgi:cell division protease FtsH
MALGYTLSLPAEDRRLIPQTRFEQEIVALLGGRAAEWLTFGEVTTGASNDLERATTIARNMVTIFGMSRLGPIKLGEREELVFLGREMSAHHHNSERVASLIDEEVSRLIDLAWGQAQQILKKHQKTLKLMATELLSQETLEDNELQKIFAKLKETKA